MAYLADRIKETTTTTGTGTYTLGGAVTAFRAFSSGFSNGQEVYYIVSDPNGADWEIGVGTYSSSTVTRNRIIASSNSNNAVNWGAGSKFIFCDAPAETFYGLTTSLGIVNNISAGNFIN